MPWFPPCYGDSESYERDRQLSELSGVPVSQYNYCRNCSPEHQAEQLAAGTCGRPGTVFLPLFDEDGELELIGVVDFDAS